jgi:hypothetical protein
MPNKEENPAAETEPSIVTTASELEKVVGDAVQEATAELTEQIKILAEQAQTTIETINPQAEEPIVTTPTELEKVVGDAVQEATAVLADKVTELVNRSKQ